MGAREDLQYNGQTIDELISLAPEYDVFEILFALERGLERSLSLRGELSAAELFVLATLAFDREVNNGGFDQFFTNSSVGFAPVIREALVAIGAFEIAEIIERAIIAIGSTDPDQIDVIMSTEDPTRDSELDACDDAFFKAEPMGEFVLEDKIFAFVKANKAFFNPQYGMIEQSVEAPSDRIEESPDSFEAAPYHVVANEVRRLRMQAQE